jgi:hypothetical protein
VDSTNQQPLARESFFHRAETNNQQLLLTHKERPTKTTEKTILAPSRKAAKKQINNQRSEANN